MNIIINHNSKQFIYEINSNIDDWNKDNYLDLIKSIQTTFDLPNKFDLYKVDDDNVAIDGIDSIKHAFQTDSDQSNQYQNTIYLRITLTSAGDDEKEEESANNNEDFVILSTVTGDNELDGDDEKKEVELEVDNFYAWCTKHGFDKYYDQFVDEYDINSLQDIIEASMDDVFDVCKDLQFTDDETQRFLNIIISSNENNELAVWCKNNKLDKFYESFVKSGYFSATQIGKLSTQERVKLCKELGIKFGAKKRFENALPGIVKVTDRTIIHLKSNTSQIDKDTLINKTILMVGETGTGKTATINSMMNYLYDAEFEGHRYKLIEEKFGKSAVKSQTNEISVYYLTPPTIDYALTIVDTPGFGNCDSKGIQFDQVIIEQLESKFKTEITEIDGVCFVIKSNQTRLTERQEYVFREIINLFGEDVANNIILLFTFDDGTEIPFGLEAVDQCKSSIPHRDKYFTFNNNGFNFKLDEKKRDNFNKAMEAFGDFFEEISKIQTQSLQLSQQVLEQRKLLKRTIKECEHRLKDGLTIYQSIDNRIKNIEENKEKIDENDQTLLTIEVPETKKVVIRKKPGWFARFEHDHKEKNEEKMPINEDKFQSFWVCKDCKITCEHSKITGWHCPGCGQDQWCESVRKRKYKYELVLKTITVPVKQLESGYLDATLYQPLSDTLLETEKKKLKQAEYDLIELIAKIRRCIEKIKELALNKTVLAPIDYFKYSDFLIEEEKKKKNNGWKDRVKALESLQQQHILIEKVEKAVNAESIESIFPEFNKIKSFHEESEKKENQRKHNMHKKNYVDSHREKRRKRKQEFRKESWWWFWERRVYNLNYKDILKDFRGHIIETEDRGVLIPIARAETCCSFSEHIYEEGYREKGYTYMKTIVPSQQTGSFLQPTGWMILHPKDTKRIDGAYLVFKGSSEPIELFINLAAIPHKIFANYKPEAIEVHGGMYGALMRDFETISNALKTLKIGDADSNIKELYITGHSLGGGYAILFGYEMIRRGLVNEQSMQNCKYNVVTFGAPSVLACSQNIAIENLLTTNKNLGLLQSISHCYVNRLDPVPRLTHLLSELPDIIENIASGLIAENISKFGAWKAAAFEMFVKTATENPLKDIKTAIISLKTEDLSSVYFSVGKQYIWCGKHKKIYCGEEMKIRTQYDVVTSFDVSKFKNMPLDLWKRMLNDHLVKEYLKKFVGKTTII